ncbi:MAG: ArnT family glycosyltransferase [Parvularculaceae bacterium]
MALIAAFAALTACAGVFSLPPLDRDESRFAQATAQMLETGDFVTIRFQEDERNKKPVGIHWLQAASVAAFSDVAAREIWAYRLPSALGAVLAALFTYLAGARLFGPRVGFAAALLLASAPAVAGEATIAKTDAMLLAAVAGAQAALVHILAATVENRKASLAAVLGFWLALGAGMLLKGPIILMIVGFTLALTAARGGRFELLTAIRPALGAIILILMVAPWALAVNEATEGRFFSEAVGGDMLAKVGAAQESHAGPPGYYLGLLFILFWPAVALIPPSAALAFSDRASWRTQFLIAWLAPSWLVFELTATKLPHYTLPLYPAIAILAARAIFANGQGETRVSGHIGAAAYCAAGLAFAALIITAPHFYQAAPIRVYSVIAAGSLAAATIATAILFQRGRRQGATIAAAFLSSALAWTLLAGVAPNLDRLKVSERLSVAIDEKNLHPLHDGAPPAALAGYREPSAIFLLGTKTILADGRAAADLALDAERAVAVEKREAPAFIDRIRERGASVEAIAVIEGVNYSNGEDVTIAVYRAAAEREAM